jgi:hypothetical protein
MNPIARSSVVPIMTDPVIRAAWYLPSRLALDVLFTSGRRYRYWGVPDGLARRFADADARGRFFNREIRGRFVCTPLEPALSRAA